jgi:ABC-type antimicrobial peptide transport system permease subunit
MRSFSRGNLKAGIDSVRSAKLRSFWTMLGVIIGVTSVITVVAIGEGIKQQIGGQIHHFGQNIITIRPVQLGTGNRNSSNDSEIISGLGVSGPLGVKDIDVVDHIKGISASSPLTIVNGTVRGDHGSYSNGFVIGATSSLPSLLNQSMAYGNFFTDGDDGTNVAVLGQGASEALFNEDVPLGRSFSFHGQQFIVRGIFNQFTTTPLSQQADFNNAIFIPNDLAESLSNNTAPTYEILARPAAGQSAKAAVSNVQRGLDQARGGQSGLSVLSANQNLAASNGILDLLTRLIAGIAAISLLVGGIGIMNVMLVSVAERMHEIGIRKAVGATNRQIMSQFMIESSVLSLTGGAIGIALAFGIDITLRAFTSLQPDISWQIVLLASGVSLAVGVVFGTVPAFKAAYKDPIEALRSE